MSLTRVMYCWAISVKMSVAGHDVCILSVAVWARETCGMAMAAAPVNAAPARNLRRDVVFVSDFLLMSSHPPWSKLGARVTVSLRW